MGCFCAVRTIWGSSKMGGISFSGIALILLAAHKCALDWPASLAIVTYYP